MLRAAKKKKLVIESVMADRNRLNALEDKLEVPTIVFFRLCAAKEIELEGQGPDSPRKLTQWKAKWSSGRTQSGSSNGTGSTGRDRLLDKMELYLAVNERMHTSSEARTSSFHEERTIEALLMALDLVVISFEVVLVEEYRVGDKSDTRDFLRFELNEFVVTVLQRTSSSTVSSRITSIQILDFRQTYEATPLERKEPQALLSMIDTISPNGQVATRKNPFVELNVESSENKLQLDCVFERFRYIHNLYATSKLRAYFIPRTEDSAPPSPVVKKVVPSPPKLTRKAAALPTELLRKKSIENAFGAPQSITKPRRNSAAARAVHTKEMVISVKLPEIDVFVHTTDASAEVEARLVGTHFQNGATHNTFELSIEAAETYFLEPHTFSGDDKAQRNDGDSSTPKRSTLMQTTSLVFYGQKLVEGYLVPKWQMKCTSPPIQFSMSSKQYQQLIQASAEWKGPSQGADAVETRKSALFVAEDERLNVCISIPQVLIDFSGEGPIQEALNAASTASEDLTGFELDIRDLNVMARFSSAAQAAAVDMSALSLVKCVKRRLEDVKADDALSDHSTTQASEVVNSSIPSPLSLGTTTADPVYDPSTGFRTNKLLELRGKTSILISSSEPHIGEVNIEQAALYWDHELLVALVRYHSASQIVKQDDSGETTTIPGDAALEPVARFGMQVRVQRWFAFFMPKMCWQEQITFVARGTDLRCDFSTLETAYVRGKLDGLGDIELIASRLSPIKFENEVEGEATINGTHSEENYDLLRAKAPVSISLESAGLGSLQHRGGAAAYYKIEGEEVQVNYLHLYWSSFLDHITKEVAAFSRWTDLLRIPAGQSLNERLSLELAIEHVIFLLPTCESEGKHRTPSDHLELDIRGITSGSRAYPEDMTQEQLGVQVKGVEILAVMAEPKRPNQIASQEETVPDDSPVRRYSLGNFSDVFIEYVGIPYIPIDKENSQEREIKSSVLDITTVLDEMEKICSYATIKLSSRSNWLSAIAPAGENSASAQEENVSSATTTLGFNPYQLELLSRVLDNNFAMLSPPPICTFSKADELKVMVMTLDVGDIALDLLDPLDSSIDNSTSDNPISGTAIARISLDHLLVASDGFASRRSQVRASAARGALWKVDYSEEVPDDSEDDIQKSEVRALCGSIFSSSVDTVARQGIDIVLDQRAPSPDNTSPSKEIRIHWDICELLPVIVEFGQRLRYFASIESDMPEQIGPPKTTLDVSITTGFVYYLAAECVPNHIDEYGNEDEIYRRLYPDNSTLKMIASGCFVGRYHSDGPETSRTQVYGRNMSVKVSSQWPPESSVLISSTPGSPSSADNSPTKGSGNHTNYERIVCDDFTVDVELTTAEDAEATMAVNLTHFHAVICTVDLFLIAQAKQVFGTEDDVSDSSVKHKKTDGSERSDKEEDDTKPAEAQSRSLAPPEIEFREDSISMVQLLLQDISITLLRQSGPHLSPIARLYTYRAMCKVTYEVGERIDGVVPTLTEVAVEFPDESLNETNGDDGVSIWGFNTALGSWEPIVEPWMFGLQGSLIRDETGEVTANLDFTGMEGHPLNVNISPAMINSLCLTAKAYDGSLSSGRPPYVSPTNVISSDCYLVNDTGAPITYWVTHDIGNASRGFTYASRRKPKRKMLSNQAKVPLELLTSISPSLGAEQTVSFCWDDNEWYPLTDIPIRNTGKYIYGVQPRPISAESKADGKEKEDKKPSEVVASSAPPPQPLYILLDVSAASGYRTFTISSLVRLFNETSIALDCSVLESDGKTITEIGMIEPKGACSVPFRFVSQIGSVRVFIKPHLYQSPAQTRSSANSKLSGQPPSADREHRWSNELFISEKESSTLHTASCSLVLDDYACKCQKMIDGTVPFHPSQICKANGSFFHAHSRIFTSSNASSLQYAQLKLMSPLTLVNNCGVPIIAVLFAFKKVRRTAGVSPDREDVHLVSSQVIPPHGRVDTLSSALQDETYCSISMTGSSWSKLFRIPSILDSVEETTKTGASAALKAISSIPLKLGNNTKNVVLSLLDFQSRTATLNVSFDSKETREKNAGHFMIVQPRFLLQNATSLPLVFSPQVKLIEKIPGTKSMMARFAKSPFSPSRKKQTEVCCGSPEMEAIHAKLNALQDQKVSEEDIDEDELQAHYYSEVSAIMVQLEGNTQQSSSAQDISLEVGANTSLRVYNEATKRYHDLVALFKQIGGSNSMVVTFVERYLLLNQTDHEILASAVTDIASKKGTNDDKKILAVPPRSTSEFSWWAHSFIPPDTCIRLKVRSPTGTANTEPEDYQWSGKFSLHDVSETALKISTPDASRICVLRVQVRVEAGVQVCVVVTSEDTAEFPLYRMINSCAHETIWFKQIFDGVKKDASAFQRGVMQSLAPGESVCFGWDEAYFLGTPNREISVWYAPKDGTTSSDYHSSILLDQPGESQQVEIPSKSALPKAPSRVYVRWHLQGLTKTMVAQDEPLNRKERAGKQTRQLVSAHGETERLTTPGFTSEVVAHFRLPHFGVSLVTSTPDELLLFSGQDVDIAYANINNDHDQCEVKIGCFQLDSQLSDAIYPVVIAPILKKGSGCVGFRDESSSISPDKQKSAEVRSAHGTEPSPEDEKDNGDKTDVKSGSRAIRPHFFHLSILRLSYDENMDYIKYFSAMMQPARIQIDEAFLLVLASFVTDCSAALEKNYPAERRRLTSEASKGNLKSSEKRFTVNSERRIYIETLQLHPVKVQLSITILNHYGETEESATGLASLVKLPLAVTKALLSSTFSQIDSATLYLNALHLNHAFASGAFLMSTVQQHYMLQGMRQIYSLIGAADILGNPVGLVTNLGVGVKDFFYEPAAGLVTSPQEFVLGLSRGTTSLFTHSLYGAFNAASKVTGTLSEGIATLSLDRKYLAERRAQGPRKQVATHIGTGLIHGTKQLGKGIFAGVTGVITAPAQGALHGGLPGFIEGVGKGLIGVAVKPAAGVLDLAATTAAGITATTSALDRRTGLGKEVYRRREPRLLRVTSDQRVRVYTPADALVSRLLLTLPVKYKLQLPNELYDTHVFLPGARILVATSLRLLLLEFASEGTLATLTTAIMSSTSIPPPLVIWSHPLSKLVGAQRTPTGIAVHLGSNAFDMEHVGSDATDKTNGEVATAMLSGLEELGTSGTDRVQTFLTELVVRHQRETAASYGTE
ncbi:hypothetical protein DVH05_007434 [Phytophthora capsici]|nr:hypothetical protein DVH05_007434 [Phytophthora capsici]